MMSELTKEDVISVLDKLNRVTDEDENIGISSSTRNNIVSNDTVKAIQLKTLREISLSLSKTFGPMGSNTMLVTGNNPNTLKVEYTKDGHKTLGSILYRDPISMATQKELVAVTGHTEHIVGDGTTSATILSYLIYDGLLRVLKKYPNTPPYNLIRIFKKLVADIQENIMSKKWDITLEDIYKICMISTNGDEELSRQLQSIYRDFGFDVDIEVGIASGAESLLKTYDGCTINTGYVDAAFINRPDNGTSEIRNPSIYYFEDSIDTPEMISLFEKIIHHNIMEPIANQDDPIPTVIFAPKFSRDMSALFQRLVDYLYSYHNQGIDSQKPPLLIVTNLCGADTYIVDDICHLCGCKTIHKYIDPKIQEDDIKKELAPTLDTVHTFCGHADMIVSDQEKTKIINPKFMYELTENGAAQVPSNTYNSIVDLLESQYKKAKANNATAGELATYRKRMRALKGNLVEYLVGGISLGDRESKKDSIVDAVKNCASAAIHGVGYAANFEGKRAAQEVVLSCSDDLENDIALVISGAYNSVTVLLYSTVFDSKDEVISKIMTADSVGCPMNFYTMEFDKSVISSIMTDVEILNAISKLITIMATSNQCLLQAPDLNIY